ncbi:hypothetical protein BDR03DRAFT_386218 [Suillus americanus]|nr:hypothetical protein BDR03DRAFT_386218 [Suillus americanus]
MRAEYPAVVFWLQTTGAYMSDNQAVSLQKPTCGLTRRKPNGTFVLLASRDERFDVTGAEAEGLFAVDETPSVSENHRFVSRPLERDRMSGRL